MDIMVISKVIFAFGKWVLQHYVFIFFNYCTLASIFIAALCLFATNPLKTVCIGYNGHEEDNSNHNSNYENYRALEGCYKVNSSPAYAGLIMHGMKYSRQISIEQ
jgi:hypothetical protein